MKTKFRILLFEEAKAWAAAHRLSFRGIDDDGVRIILAAGGEQNPFRLRDGSFGPFTPVQKREWSEFRETIYAGRGE